MRSLCLLLYLLPLCGSVRVAHAQLESDPLAQSTQIMVVTTPGWNDVAGHLQRYERATPQDTWQPIGDSTPIVVGKHGLAWGLGVMRTVPTEIRAAADPVKQEGDGRSPAGIFTLGTAFGYAPDRLQGSKLPYLPLTYTTECVDDVASKHYNLIVDRTTFKPDWDSSEQMRSAGISYTWGIVVNHNTAPAQRSGGSCIFLHIWSGPTHGTAGCTAMPQSDLETLLMWLDPKRNPLLVQLPAQKYETLIQRWKLPTTVNPPTH